ncbi:hypothetical protein SD71_10850 [Cohnella kolymensis]|uniref:Uncharacterized protein n=1 Tax=Cohnella kolymensis TaxID=1590652 RepID=A0ABR5A4A8_9BACL|nr:hypothetical protein [Cohnella kolymensis]KIL35879.1 hypothetical protein SD71_10850 [Cohnella kolymensis]
MSIIILGSVALVGVFLYDKISDIRLEKKWAWVDEQVKPLPNGRINVDDFCDVLDEAERKWKW